MSLVGVGRAIRGRVLLLAAERRDQDASHCVAATNIATHVNYLADEEDPSGRTRELLRLVSAHVWMAEELPWKTYNGIRKA